MLKWIKRNSPWLITALCTIVSLVLWLIFQNRPNLTSLFINLTAGFFVSTFTICIIDRILKKQREKDLRPLQEALYRDVSKLKNEIVSLWSDMYVQSVEQRTEIQIEELFTKDVLQEIYDHLDLEGKPIILQMQNWFQNFEYTYGNSQKTGDKILERYNFVAPPEMLKTIHYLINNSVFAGELLHRISITKQIDISRKVKRLPMMNCYIMFPQDKDIIEIHNLIRGHKELAKELFGKSFNSNSERVKIVNPHTKPSSIISDEKLQDESYNKSHVIVCDKLPPIAKQ